MPVTAFGADEAMAWATRSVLAVGLQTILRYRFSGNARQSFLCLMMTKPESRLYMNATSFLLGSNLW